MFPGPRRVSFLWSYARKKILRCPFRVFHIPHQVQKDSGSTLRCTLRIFPALAFTADFPPVAPEFHQRTHRVRLRIWEQLQKNLLVNQVQKDSGSTLSEKEK